MYSCWSWSILRMMALMDGSHSTRTPVGGLVGVERCGCFQEGERGGLWMCWLTFDGFGHGCGCILEVDVLWLESLHFFHMERWNWQIP